ncbi:MAG: hypothetical protein IGS03_02135 [Candidatus Sericytochromatia bacterium]|nr:hypothetical protein [Candidatus Sericytochromatia bacterium]
MRKQMTAGIFGAILTFCIQGAYKEMQSSSHYQLESGMGSLSILDDTGGVLSLKNPDEDSAFMDGSQLMFLEKEDKSIVRTHLNGKGLAFFEKSSDKVRFFLSPDSGSIIFIDNKGNKKIIQ